MSIFEQLNTAGGDRAAGFWRRTEGWAQEERPLRVVRKIVIDGSTDLVLCRGSAARMLVASEDPEWLSRIHTNVVGDKLRIEQDPIVPGRTNITRGKGRRVTQTFHGPIQQVVYAAPLRHHGQT